MNAISSSFDETTILAQMDQYTRTFDFPVLDNSHLRIGKVRLTSFLNIDEWLIVFEIVTFDVRSYTYENMIYAYGNRLSKPGFQTGLDAILEPSTKPFYDDEDNFKVDLLNFKAIIDNREQNFLLTDAEYIQAGITPTLKMEPEAKLLRVLCFLLPKETFLLTEAEMLTILKRRELNKFLQLDEWFHPDIAKGELPSQNVCLRNLAKALAERNKDIYHCANKENTHWSNWLIPPL